MDNSEKLKEKIRKTLKFAENEKTQFENYHPCDACRDGNNPKNCTCEKLVDYRTVDNGLQRQINLLKFLLEGDDEY